jgi:transposase
MGRRKFSCEFKVEAVRLIKERGVSAVQASRDLDVHVNVLRKWVRNFHRANVGFSRPRPNEGRAARDHPSPA